MISSNYKLSFPMLGGIYMKHSINHKKHSFITRTACGILTVSLAGTGLASYTAYASKNPTGSETQTMKVVTTTPVDQEEDLTKEIFKSTKVEERSIDKAESVYLITDANGNIQQTIVSEHLFNNTHASTLQDISTLSNIENVEGNEAFEQNGKALTWDAEGSEIYYQGTTDKEVPVTQKVTYYLNDQEISPEELAGKSGTVRIRFDYTNTSQYTEIVNGEKVTVCVPFAAITGLILPEDADHVEVTNGRLINAGGNDMVIGYALPGLKESLDIDDTKLDEGVTLPEYFEVQADVKDFALSSCMTAVVNAGNMMTTEGIDLTSMDEALDALTDASGQMEDGARELADGLDLLQSKLNEYAEGMTTFNNGVQTYTTGVDKVAGGVNSAYNGSCQLAAGFQGNDANTGLVDGAKSVANGAAALNDGIQTIPTTLGSQMESAKAGTISKLKSELGESGVALVCRSCGVNDITADNLGSVTTAFASATARQTFGAAMQQAVLDKVTAEVNANRDTITAAVTAQVSASVRAQVEQSIRTACENAGITDEAVIQNQINSQADALTAAQMASPEIQTLITTNVDNTIAAKIAEIATPQMIAEQTNTNYTTILAGLNKAAGAIEALNGVEGSLMESAQSGDMKTLLDGAAALKQGASDLSSGVDQAYNGVQKLNEGLSQLADGTSTLNAGSSTLADGSKKLNASTTQIIDGVQKLDDGSHTLADGIVTFNQEGIDELLQAYQGDIKPLANRLQAVVDAGEDYHNFAGIADGQNGTVKFIYKLSAI